MALESWLASLKRDVSGVSDVQTSSSKGSARYVTETADVSGVSLSAFAQISDTSDTSQQNQTYHRKPRHSLADTSDTPDTPQIINTDAETDLTQPDAGLSKVEDWLRLKLDSVQPAAIVAREGAAAGFSPEDLEAARLAIGAVALEMVGFIFWRLPDVEVQFCSY